MFNTDSEPPYKAGMDSTESWYVAGPGEGLHYYGGTLYPELRFKSRKEAEIAARVANIAYNAGAEATKTRIRNCLGVIDG